MIAVWSHTSLGKSFTSNSKGGISAKSSEHIIRQLVSPPILQCVLALFHQVPRNPLLIHSSASVNSMVKLFNGCAEVLEDKLLFIPFNSICTNNTFSSKRKSDTKSNSIPFSLSEFCLQLDDSITISSNEFIEF